MKKSKKKYMLLTLFVASLAFFSCQNEEVVQVIKPVFNPSSNEFNIDYNAGELSINMNSNVIFYARVEKADQSWLSFKYEDSCKVLVAKYLANDTIVQRIGHIIVSKSGVEDTLTFTQAGNPNANNGKEQKIDLNYTVSSQGGYTILNTTADESNKIPIGAIVVIECKEDVGTISLVNSSTYAEYLGGSPVNKKIMFVWTHDMLNTTAKSGIMGVIRDSLEVTGMYCLYSKTNLNYSLSTQGGYNMLNTTSEISNKIPIGATVVLDCAADTGTVSLIDSATYAEYAGGTPENKKISFTWTKEMADMTATSGIMGVLHNGVEIKSMYFLYTKIDLAFTTETLGGFNILKVAPEVSALIPQGATVVLESPDDVGTISFINESTYAEYASGAPVNGIFSFVWTKDMITITAGNGMEGVMRSGYTPSSMYCHN